MKEKNQVWKVTFAGLGYVKVVAPNVEAAIARAREVRPGDSFKKAGISRVESEGDVY